MARAVYSVLFVAEEVTPLSGLVSIGPVGDDTAVLRDLRVLDFGGEPGDQLNFIFEPVGRTWMRLVVSSAEDYLFEWFGRQVIPSGNHIDITSSTGAFNVFASGYNLTAS